MAGTRRVPRRVRRSEQPGGPVGLAAECVCPGQAGESLRYRLRVTECLRSVLAHTPSEVPILICDDASPDERSRRWVAERNLTGRGATRIRRVARTLADLDDAAGIAADHLDLASEMRGDVP